MHGLVASTTTSLGQGVVGSAVALRQRPQLAPLPRHLHPPPRHGHDSNASLQVDDDQFWRLVGLFFGSARWQHDAMDVLDSRRSRQSHDSASVDPDY